MILSIHEVATRAEKLVGDYELGIWEDLCELTLRQRNLILSRGVEELAELNDQFEAHMLSAARCREESLRQYGSSADIPNADKIAKLQRKASMQAQVNQELLADALACFTLALQTLYPQSKGPTYDRTGAVQQCSNGVAVSKSA